jgi:hypothetical protein
LGGERWQAIADGKAAPTPAEATFLLELSSERDHWLRRVLNSWRQGFRAGRESGWQEGYAAREADEKEQWAIAARLLLAAVRPVLNPAADAADAARRVRAAEAACRRDAAEHEREYVARAYSTHPRDRTDAQRATVCSYPPPDRRPRRRADRDHLRVVGGD